MGYKLFLAVLTIMLGSMASYNIHIGRYDYAFFQAVAVITLLMRVGVNDIVKAIEKSEDK